MGLLAEKQLTLSMTFHIKITDDELKPQRQKDQELAFENRRLLLALLAHGQQDLCSVLLTEIAHELDQLSDEDFEEALLGRCASDDSDFFFRGGMWQTAIAALDAADQERWRGRMDIEHEELGNLFFWSTEKLARCIHVKLIKAAFLELKEAAVESKESETKRKE
ncbi:MAG TPA: hypothetical protein VFV38_30780 [Ktedonobacteraceae bacterium]|nr:hypothetical protein [Ktedonobacteraceae bacterium]